MNCIFEIALQNDDIKSYYTLTLYNYINFTSLTSFICHSFVMLSCNLCIEYKCKVCHFYKAINKCALSINVRYVIFTNKCCRET